MALLRLAQSLIAGHLPLRTDFLHQSLFLINPAYSGNTLGSGMKWLDRRFQIKVQSYYSHENDYLNNRIYSDHRVVVQEGNYFFYSNGLRDGMNFSVLSFNSGIRLNSRWHLGYGLSGNLENVAAGIKATGMMTGVSLSYLGQRHNFSFGTAWKMNRYKGDFRIPADSYTPLVIDHNADVGLSYTNIKSRLTFGVAVTNLISGVSEDWVQLKSEDVSYRYFSVNHNRRVQVNAVKTFKLSDKTDLISSAWVMRSEKEKDIDEIYRRSEVRSFFASIVCQKRLKKGSVGIGVSGENQSDVDQLYGVQLNFMGNRFGVACSFKSSFRDLHFLSESLKGMMLTYNL